MLIEKFYKLLHVLLLDHPSLEIFYNILKIQVIIIFPGSVLPIFHLSWMVSVF